MREQKQEPGGCIVGEPVGYSVIRKVISIPSTTQEGDRSMPEEPERRLSMRMTAQMEKAIDEHVKRLEKRNPGVEFTKTQAVGSLVEAGAMAWRTSEKAGTISPAALLSWAAGNFGRRKK